MQRKYREFREELTELIPDDPTLVHLIMLNIQDYWPPSAEKHDSNTFEFALKVLLMKVWLNLPDHSEYIDAMIIHEAERVELTRLSEE